MFTQAEITRLSNLVIPVSAFYKHKPEDSQPSRPELMEHNRYVIKCGLEQSVCGIIKDDNLFIDTVVMGGEGSGRFLDCIFVHTLTESKGTLIAHIVWEDGTVCEFQSIDGEVKEKQLVG